MEVFVIAVKIFSDPIKQPAVLDVKQKVAEEEEEEEEVEAVIIDDKTYYCNVIKIHGTVIYEENSNGDIDEDCIVGIYVKMLSGNLVPRFFKIHNWLKLKKVKIEMTNWKFKLKWKITFAKLKKILRIFSTQA